MPRASGSEIPAGLSALLDGRDLERKVGQTFLLLTTAADGWPHAAMLSAGEVVATGARELRLALWPGSQTTANLGRTQTALLLVVAPPSTYHVRLRCRPLGSITAAGRPLAAFGGQVVEVLDDVVAYAEVLDGIRFKLVDPERTVAGWRAAMEALRKL